MKEAYLQIILEASALIQCTIDSLHSMSSYQNPPEAPYIAFFTMASVLPYHAEQLLRCHVHFVSEKQLRNGLFAHSPGQRVLLYAQ